MASKPPPKPKPPSNIEDKNARSQYEKDLTAYYEKQGVKKPNDQADRDIEALRNNQRNAAAAQKIDQKEKDRIRTTFTRTMGRPPTDEDYVKLNGKKDEEINSYVTRTFEYQERVGAIRVIRSSEEEGHVIAFNDNEQGRALMQDQEFNRNRWGPGDSVILPQGTTRDQASALSGDLWATQEEKDQQVVTQEMYDNPQNAWLRSSGYQVGDRIQAQGRQSGGGFNLIGEIDEALGSNIGEFIAENVSDQVLAIAPIALVPILGPGAAALYLPGVSNLVYDDWDRAINEGGAKALGVEPEDIQAARAVADIGVNIALTIADPTGSALAAKTTLQNLGYVASGQQSWQDFGVNTLVSVGTAYIGSALGSSNLATAPAYLRGGQAAANLALNYGANVARGMDSSQAFREAGWSALGTATGGAATAIRLGFSESAQNRLRNPATGEIDPILGLQALANIGLQAYTFASQAESNNRSALGQLGANFSPTTWNPLAGGVRLAGAANKMYETISGATYTSRTETYTPEMGEIPTGGQYTVRAGPGVEEGSANYGNWVESSTRQGDTVFTTRATQNYLPSLGGLRNFGATIGNAILFQSIEAPRAASGRSMGFSQTNLTSESEAYVQGGGGPLTPRMRASTRSSSVSSNTPRLRTGSVSTL